MCADQYLFMIGYLIIGLLHPTKTCTCAQSAAKRFCLPQPPINKRKQSCHVAHVLLAARVAKVKRYAKLRQAIGYLPTIASIGLLLHSNLSKIGIRIAEVGGFGQMGYKRTVKKTCANRRILEKRLC